MSSSDAESSSDDDLLASPVFQKRDRRTERAVQNQLDFLAVCLEGSDARTDVHRRIASVRNEFNNEKDEAETDGQDAGGDRPEVDSSTANSGEHANATAAQKTESVVVKTEKHDEDAYWKKIEYFAEENAHKTRGGAGCTLSARSKLNDTISGLEGYDSDLTDDEGGKWKGGVSGMTREQLRSEAEARAQGLSSHLGLRRMFRPAVDRGGAISSALGFLSREQALRELREAVASMQRSHRSSRTPEEKTLRRQFLDPLVRITKQRKDCIWDYLTLFLCKNPALAGKYVITLPATFCEWMWKLVCSPFQVGQHSATTCLHLMRRFITNELDVCRNIPSFRADLSFLKNLCMDDLVSSLENHFGLWLEHGPVALSAVKSGGSAKEGTTGASKEKGSRVDVCVLKNIFLMWTALFRRNLIQVRTLTKDTCLGKDASRALVAFARVGLDPHFYSANDCTNTSGETLHQLLQNLIISLVRSITSQIRAQCGDSHVEQWVNQATGHIVDACIDLSAGEVDAADSDDVNGDLPLARVVKSICSSSFSEASYFELTDDFTLLKLNLVEQALHTCLKNITDWDVKVKKRTDFHWKDVDKDAASGGFSTAMHALVTAEVGFLWIEEELDSIKENQPHFLAAILIAGECVSVGHSLFWSAQNAIESKEPVYTTEEKDAVYESVSNIEDMCYGLKKECRAVIAHPHLRRAKEYLTRLAKVLAGTKGKSSKDKRQKRREQGSLDSYFSRPSLSDAFRETQDS